MASIMADDNRQWILSEAKQLLKDDEFAAKSWLLVGKTLFPRCFSIRHEMYILEKNSKRAVEASKYLEELIATFYQEDRVWEEIVLILKVVLSEDSSTVNEDNLFLKEIFEKMPRELQAVVLSEVVRRSTQMLSNISQQSKLLLYIVENYSKELPNQGTPLVELWLTGEVKNSESTSRPINFYREELALHVLPKVLISSDKLSPTQVMTWYLTALEYFVFLAADDSLTTPTKLLRGWPMRTCDSSSSKATTFDPWDKIRSLGKLVGKKLGWPDSLDVLFQSKGQKKANYQLLEEAYSKCVTMATQEDTESSKIEFLKQFVLLLTSFLECLHSYSLSLDQFVSSKSTADTEKMSRALVDISLFIEVETAEDLRAKKPKFEENMVESSTILSTTRSDIVDNFLVAAKLWSILNNGIFTSKLSSFYNHWLVEKTWPWMNQFKIDIMMYEGRHKEALQICQGVRINEKNDDPDLKIIQYRSAVQLVCSAFRSCSSNVFLEMVIYILDGIKTVILTSPKIPPTRPSTQFDFTSPAALLDFYLIEPQAVMSIQSDFVFPARRKDILMKFIPISERGIFSYCIQALICCFCKVWRSRSMGVPPDMILGHIIVLMQYDLRHNEFEFCDIIEFIKKQGRFSYPPFVEYVINVDILEEFVHIQSSIGGQVMLDLLPTSNQVPQVSRTVTRAANQSEMTSVLMRQVLRYNEDIHKLLMTFIQKEAKYLRNELN